MTRAVPIDETELREMWPRCTLARMAAHFNCSVKAVFSHAEKLGLPPKMSYRVRRPRKSQSGAYTRPAVKPRPYARPSAIPSIPMSRLMAGR